jgi:hypothetical protein
MNVNKLKKRKVMENKFGTITEPPKVPLKQRIIYFLRGLVFWKGRASRNGFVHTRDLEWSDFRFIFFPKGFEEKYGYLGTAIWEESSFFNYMYPLVLAMDYEAKPKWCPRWFLRFLHVFGNDKSIVRVRNQKLNYLHRKLTKGIQFWDWKTKWSDYDLRITIGAPKHLQELADAIESKVYHIGREEELIEQIKKLDPNAGIIRGSIERLEKQLENLENTK